MKTKVTVGVESEPRIQFTMEADTANMPDLIRLKDGQLLRFVGFYASPGYNCGYRHVNETREFDGDVKEWTQYQPLVG